MAFVSIRARPAFGRAGWMKGEQAFGDSITASIDGPATAGVRDRSSPPGAGAVILYQFQIRVT
jgi:hypothetical protein